MCVLENEIHIISYHIISYHIISYHITYCRRFTGRPRLALCSTSPGMFINLSTCISNLITCAIYCNTYAYMVDE